MTVKYLSEDLLEHIRVTVGAQHAREGALVQRLWAGYGEICRIDLTGAKWPSAIVKQVRPPQAPSSTAVSGARDHARKLRSYSVEAAWYERYAARCNEHCRVARLLWSAPAGQLIVLEDLDAAGFSRRCATPDRSGMLACLDWLAHFHATFLEAPVADLWPTGTYWHLATRPDELAASSDLTLRAAAVSLDARLQGARFRTLVHGDAKVANFCFTPALSAVAAVDFQYVGPGVGVQDVAYFISSCLDDAACSAHAADLLDHYFSTLRQVLATQRPELDAAALETEWRALYPTAWADFCRFLSGWMAERYVPGRYDQRMIALALSR